MTPFSFFPNSLKSPPLWVRYESTVLEMAYPTYEFHSLTRLVCALIDVLLSQLGFSGVHVIQWDHWETVDFRYQWYHKNMVVFLDRPLLFTHHHGEVMKKSIIKFKYLSHNNSSYKCGSTGMTTTVGDSLAAGRSSAGAGDTACLASRPISGGNWWKFGSYPPWN